MTTAALQVLILGQCFEQTLNMNYVLCRIPNIKGERQVVLDNNFFWLFTKYFCLKHVTHDVW